jgi:hypothetical protein
MSFIYPQNYTQICNDLGAAYALVKQSIYNVNSTYHGGATPVYDSNVYYEEAYDVTLTNDNDFSRTSSDPIGSISNDLGTTWFNISNNNFTETNAKTTAAGLFASALQSLNLHVVRRTGVSNISTFYSTYAYSSTWSGVDPADYRKYDLFMEADTSSYFTQAFAELSSTLGNTINSSYIDPTSPTP